MYIVYINIVIIIFGFWFLVALREIFAASGGLKSRPVCVCVCLLIVIIIIVILIIIVFGILWSS